MRDRELDANPVIWDLLQDTQGVIAVFNAQLSLDKSYIIAQASLATTMVDPYSAYCFICPEFKAVCETQGLAIGALYLQEYGDQPVKLPVVYLELYPAYIDYLKTNVEGKTRRKIEGKNKKTQNVDYIAGSDFNIGDVALGDQAL